jgi:hypothetical protein
MYRVVTPVDLVRGVVTGRLSVDMKQKILDPKNAKSVRRRLNRPVGQ